MRAVEVLRLALATALAMTFAGQAAGENVLRWASAGGVLTWDPHGSTTETPSLVGFRQVYETLVTIDADLIPRPALALAWRLIDPTTWHFELRPGVSFHDGTPFSAEDVVFSIERARSAGSDLAAYTSSIAAVQAVDDATVEITTRHPDMLLPVSLRQVAMLSKPWAERHGIATARPYAQGAPPLDQANGTGPFMLDSHETGRRTVLVRNPHWWGSAEFPHNLDRVIWSIVSDPKERLELLLNGQTDFVQDPPLEALGSLRTRPGLKLVETGELRVLLLGLNQGTPELHSGDVEGANPFQDKRVRQALLPCDRHGGATRWRDGGARDSDRHHRPAGGQWLRAGARPEALLRSGAGQSTACAGGLSRRLRRHPRLSEQPIRQRRGDLPGGGEIGVRVTVDAQPKEVHFVKLFERRTDFYLLGYLTPTFDSALHFRELYHSQSGRWGATGYANPALDALIERIDAELVTYVRDALIEEAWRMILDDVVVIPLHRQTIVWAMRDGLDLPVSPLNSPTFSRARLN